MRNATRYPLAFLFLAGLAVPAVVQAQIPEDAIPLQTTLGALAVLRDGYTKAYNAKESAKVAAYYVDDAVIVSEDGRVLVGAPEIATTFMAETSGWPHMVLTPQRTNVYGTTAIDEGIVVQHPAGGGEVQMRYLAVLKRGYQHRWQILRLVLVPIPPAGGR